MSKILIVCDGQCRAVIGCIDSGHKEYCGMCERFYPKMHSVCPWSSWGGKKKENFEDREFIKETCSYCSRKLAKKNLALVH